MPLVSKFQFHLGAELAQPVGADLVGSVRVDYAWRDKYFFTEFNTADAMQGSYGTVDLSASLAPNDNGWRLYAYLRNVTNETTINALTINSSLLGSSRLVNLNRRVASDWASSSTFEKYWQNMSWKPNHPPREDVARAYAHLQSLQMTDDLNPMERVALVRRFIDDFGASDKDKALEGVAVTTVSANGVDAEYLVPRGAAAARRIVHFHGGGWMSGSLQSHRGIAAILAKQAHCAVLLVEYRLAPEHAYPAALDDCMNAYLWALDNGPDGAARAEAVHLLGDSSGAALATAVCTKCITEGIALPKRIALLTPYLDAAPSDYDGRYDPLISTEINQSNIPVYTLGKVAPTDPLICPMQTPRQILSQFPPTLVQVSGDEFFLEGARRFSTRLTELGVRCTLSTWPQMPHGWQVFLDVLPESHAALREAALFLHENL